jgi:hypothetical protein
VGTSGVRVMSTEGGRRRWRRAALLVIVIVCAAVLLRALGVLGGPEPPKAIKDLVALAPPGAQVTLTHTDKNGFTGLGGSWSWSFHPPDPSAALAAYRSWFTAGGYDLVPAGTDGIGPNDLVLVGFEVSVQRTGDGIIKGSVADIAIGRDGALRHLPPP